MISGIGRIALAVVVGLTFAVDFGSAQVESARQRDDQLVAEALRKLCETPETAAQIAEQRLEESPPLSPRLRAKLLWISGSAHALTQRSAKALQRLIEGKSLAREQDDRKLLRRILRYEAAVRFELSQYQAGSSAAAEAIAISQELADSSAYVALLHNELASNESRLGHYEIALQNYQQARDIARRNGKPRLETMVIANLANLFDELNQFANAAEMYREVINRGQESGDYLVVGAATVNLGNSLLATGDLSGAKKSFREAKQLAESPHLAHVEALAETGLGDLECLRGNFESARARYGLAAAIWDELGDVSGQLTIQERLTMIASQNVPHSVTIQAYETALAEAEAIGDKLHALTICDHLTEAHKKNNEWQAAAERLEYAQEIRAQIWTDGNQQALGKAQADYQVVQKQRKLDALAHRNELQRVELKSSQRLAALLAIVSILTSLVIALLWRSQRSNKKALRQLQLARRYFESLVESVREPLVVLDRELRVQSCNESFYRTFHVTREETEGRLIYELGNRQWDIPELRKRLGQILPEHRNFNDFEVMHEFEKIGHRSMLLNARPIRHVSDRADQILLAIEDNTAQKRAEQNRAERVASLGTLATGLAHEIKNPLAALVTAAQAALNLKDKPGAGEKLKRSLQNVFDSAQRCNEIVDKLRAFVGGRSTEEQLGDLNEVVRSAVASTRAFCESHHACIDLAVQRDLPPVPISAVEIELLLLNLIHNSAQAGEADVQITICTEQTNDGVRLTVQDNGPGISKEAEQRAFEPFYSTRHDEGGMGLGLSIAHGIVADHNGSIDIEGEVGTGTTVTVELPIAGGHGA